MSLIAMNNQGQWGVATNIENFSFVVATENEIPTVYITKNINGNFVHEKASQKWLDEYTNNRKKILVKKV